MSESVRQSLSALMDDEADQFEVRRILQQADDDAVQVWSRYHVAQSVLRGDAPAREQLDISNAILAALEQEPAHAEVSKRSFWRPFSSVAVAASVTAMVIFGAQQFESGEAPAEVAASDQRVLPAPVTGRSGILPAQYGAGEVSRSAPMIAENDVIRLSSSMEYYIHQHHALIRDRGEHWQAGWLPAGYAQVRHDLMSDAEVILYSNGRSAISVSIEPYGKQKARPGAVQEGDTVAFGKQIGDQFVTVVGELPLMMADRIASSVMLSE